MTTTARPTSTATIPALVNPGGGSADEVLDVLRKDARFALEETKPDRLAARLRELIDAGATRIAGSGGDGTIASAAAVLADGPVELAVIPGGTLNHLARDYGIPTEPREAAELAATGRAKPIDVADVNRHLFLNTSSVGAYVTFVRTRERLEKRMGYWLASIAAGFQILARMPRFTVHIDASGGETAERTYRACLVFLSVGERDFDKGVLGARTPDSKSGLHVIVVPNAGLRQLSRIVIGAVFRGMKANLGEVDTFLVDRCRIEMPRKHGNVACDGEIVPLDAPLAFQLKRDALQLVQPQQMPASAN
jgi:diacylglycerol kinase family enzyme